jgi:hypothetical protein
LPCYSTPMKRCDNRSTVVRLLKEPGEKKSNVEKRARCYADNRVSVNLPKLFASAAIAPNEQPAGKGILRRPFLSYNLSNSQWYILMAEDAAELGIRKAPQRSKAGRCSNNGRLFPYVAATRLKAPRSLQRQVKQRVRGFQNQPHSGLLVF